MACHGRWPYAAAFARRMGRRSGRSRPWLAPTYVFAAPIAALVVSRGPDRLLWQPGGRSRVAHVASLDQERGRLLIGNQGGFQRAVGEEEVAGTVDQLSAAVDLLTRAATGARRRAAESL
jgi:hypothetical protein